jgi:hypothetical protein
VNPEIERGKFLFKGISIYSWICSSDQLLSSRFIRGFGLRYLLWLFTLFFLVPPAFSSDEPFDNSANWGGTGLMEMPTARVPGDGVMGFGYAQALPYSWFTGGMAIYEGVELSFRLTKIANIPSSLGSDYGANKDKALDFKWQLIPESRIFPAVAVGLQDFWGTRLFPSEYLVFSRQLFPLDISLGVATKRLNGTSLPFADDLGLFGGVELALNEQLALMAEYNPIEYENDTPSARGVPEGAKYPVNFGIRWEALPGMNLGLSWQRGDTLGLSIHIRAALGKPILSHKANPPLMVPVDRKPFNERDLREMIEKIHSEIRDAGFSDVSVSTDGRSLAAEFENKQFFSYQKAAGRVLRIILFHSPADAEKISVVIKKLGLPLLKVSVRPDHLERYLYGDTPEDIFLRRHLNIEFISDPSGLFPDGRIMTQKRKESPYDFDIRPGLSTYLNDPSGFAKFRLSIVTSITADMWKGASSHAMYKIPLYSNISSSNVPPEDAVRSDSWRYSGTDNSLDRLMFNQTFRLSDRDFGRISLGYLENMYAGAGGEILSFLGKGNFAIGAETDRVIKRTPGSVLELEDFERETILANAYYFLPGPDITLHAQYGKFLAEDVGWMFDISRQYDTGLIMGAYVSFTDTDHLTDFNKGYNNKGVYMKLPARAFFTHDSIKMYNYRIAPWTRDVAATVNHWQNIYEIVGDLTPAKFMDGLDSIGE